MMGGFGDSGFGDSSGGASGSSFPWAQLLAGLLPGLGSLFGGNSMQSSLSQMQGSESAMSSQLMQMIGGLNNDFSKYYQPAMGAEGSSIMSDLQSSQGNLPLSNEVYAQMAKTGLSPQVQTNAMNQLLQGYNSSMNDLRSQATPGGNLGAEQLGAQNQYLTQAANQSAQLAGESQQYKAQGAQGLAGNEMNTLGAANSFIGQGVSMEGNAMNSLDSLYQSMAQQAGMYAQASAGQPSMGSGIGSILGSIMPFMGMFGM
jgi:hypothetical protein